MTLSSHKEIIIPYKKNKIFLKILS
jgi:hypothetical protein